LHPAIGPGLRFALACRRFGHDGGSDKSGPKTRIGGDFARCEKAAAETRGEFGPVRRRGVGLGRQRGKARVEAERAWEAFADQTGVPVGIFRLSGIYGPGRGPVEKLRRGQARAVIKPGQVFNRIHVEDIATALEAAMSRSGERSGARIYNVTDDEPAPPQDVLDFAADLIGVPRPPRVPFEEANMSLMARSFYADNKRTSNARMKQELDVTLAYPTYREGMRALAQADG